MNRVFSRHFFQALLQLEEQMESLRLRIESQSHLEVQEISSQVRIKLEQDLTDLRGLLDQQNGALARLELKTSAPSSADEDDQASGQLLALGARLTALEEAQTSLQAYIGQCCLAMPRSTPMSSRL